MSNTAVTVVLRGKASFAKILGDPVLNYSKDGKEWKMDLQIDKDTVKEVKSLGIGDRVKTRDNYLDGAPFLSFKQSEFKKSGEPNTPIPVKDIKGEVWDQSKLIGNGSDVDVKFVVMDFGPGKKKGVYIRAVRVLKLVQFNKQEFEPVDEDDEFYVADEDTEFKKDFDIADGDDLNDDLPV